MSPYFTSSLCVFIKALFSTTSRHSLKLLSPPPQTQLFVCKIANIFDTVLQI